MEEIMSRAECYIKGEESNAEKKTRDTKERNSLTTDRRNYYPPPNRDRGTFKRQERRIYSVDDFTPLNTRPERIYKEVYQTKMIPKPPEPRGDRMGHDLEAWSKYHKIRGHTTDNCWRLKKEIDKLIQEGKLGGYVKGERSEDEGRPPEEENEDNHRKDPKECHTLNTISGGFAGGGESSASRKKYVRQVMFIDDRATNSENEQDITFTSDDYEGVVPHDDDPMVITLQIFNWDVKRVLIDPGSSADILYYDAFEKLGLAPEQLQPFKGTVAGFTGEQVHVRGYVTLKTTFGSGENAETIKVKYLVINAPNSYNIIIG
ncbi:uncharacterized protein [Medicago truncatula]|uniref:uncharacterized protein n=1 Tax=Medicago truncatula TaxID=3880 RepID=UPI000D2F1DE5|nr:uncharacterized protein LOC112418563 [Medicago truncatula]